MKRFIAILFVLGETIANISANYELKEVAASQAYISGGGRAIEGKDRIWRMVMGSFFSFRIFRFMFYRESNGIYDHCILFMSILLE